ncbi:MAG: zinc metallopeptidase, partial [Candidatus Poribacteria bacterium]|nr:zinc metallopeptidase [Candidatus Poribacteria bacterium]
MFFDPVYFLFLAPALILMFWAQAKVQGAFAKYSKVGTQAGLTGAEVAVSILRANGISDVRVEPVQGFLSDHYDPTSKVLRLSPNVFQGRSQASVGVAAHEVGHAIQHARGYAPLQIRSALVPVVQIGSMMWIPLSLLGFFIGG